MSDYNKVNVYVNTYNNYNAYDLYNEDVTIEGEWFTPADYDSWDEFMNALYKHFGNETSPEFMFQDYENMPRPYCNESSFDEEVFNYCKYVDENTDKAFGAFCWVEEYGYSEDWDEGRFEEMFAGEYDSAEDYCWQFINDCGGIDKAISSDTLKSYFNYTAFGRDLKTELDEEDSWEKDLLEMSDYDCAEEYIACLGGVNELSTQIKEEYFEIDDFARDCQYNGDFDYYNGCVFVGY